MKTEVDKIIERNQYGHIIKGFTNINNLWYARGSIVDTLNRLNIMLLGMNLSQDRKGIEKIIKLLKKRLTKTNDKLRIPRK